MTKVKICGLTRPEDVAAVNRCGADFAGFVFAKSKRQVSPEAAMRLIEALDHKIVPTGVFVDEDIASVANIAASCALGAVQLHGSGDNDYIARLRRMLRSGVIVVKAVRVRDEASLKQARNAGGDLLLLDAYSGESPGGTGKTFDWSILKGFDRPYLLAGGLNAENVAEAIALLKPFGVDVSTGVETDGKKDGNKIAEFIRRAGGGIA